TFSSQLSELPDSTRVFPGHDYIANNLEFTLNREPDNAKASELLATAAKHDPHQAIVTTLGLEKEINTFFRLQNPSVIKTLREEFASLPDKPNSREVFLRLRELRNNW
ncbi:MAG TPA: hydroxyacylglutathione hydrolase, partial [Alphaproteobacteria bacterium]|nr:hydroxyacylglutathione hydrolase [Alphaproteobacteria bacterium]